MGDFILFLLFQKVNLVAGSCKCKKNPVQTILEALRKHTICCVLTMALCVYLVNEWELGSSWSSYTSLGLCKDFLASMRLCIVYALLYANGFVQVFCLCEYVNAGSLVGHICDHRLLLTQVIILSSKPLAVSGFHLQFPSSAKLQAQT